MALGNVPIFFLVVSFFCSASEEGSNSPAAFRNGMYSPLFPFSWRKEFNLLALSSSFSRDRFLCVVSFYFYSFHETHRGRAPVFINYSILFFSEACRDFLLSHNEKGFPQESTQYIQGICRAHPTHPLCCTTLTPLVKESNSGLQLRHRSFGGDVVDDATFRLGGRNARQPICRRRRLILRSHHGWWHRRLLVGESFRNSWVDTGISRWIDSPRCWFCSSSPPSDGWQTPFHSLIFAFGPGCAQVPGGGSHRVVVGITIITFLTHY
ncbi:hypothetical protein BDQ12DRAFT_52136 [Crucibulum laeve]|uniref:Secreted protein n=1 Tax=Crucibulum laeve TaxID=68775 RepID=A0A5C3M447_9AGAR|nr:hypothetical protein BDQ12DRAFT_52136 [Crucibulum laeve]